MALYATNRFAGDGVTTSYEFNFVGKYLARSHVKAYQEDNATKARTPVAVSDSNFLNDTTLHMLPVTPVGKTLVIYRDTPKAPLVNFVNGSRFTEYNLDTATRQGAFIAAEGADASLGNVAESADRAEAAAQIAAGASAVAVTAKDQAVVAAAEATGAAQNNLKSFDSFADAATGATLLQDDTAVEVSQDETRVGARTRYKVQAGALVFVVNLDQTKLDLAAATGASLVGFQQAGTGAVPTTVQSKLRESVSVKDFGAVGDGVTDDTAAIQAAFDAAYASGVDPVCGEGTYLLSGDVTLRRRLRTNGVVAFKATEIGDVPPTVNFIQATRGELKHIRFEYLNVLVNGSNERGFTPTSIEQNHFVNCTLKIGSGGIATRGYAVVGNTFANSLSRDNPAILLINVSRITVVDNNAQEFASFLRAEPTISFASDGIAIKNNSVSNCIKHIELLGTSMFRLSNVHISGNTLSGSQRESVGVGTDGIRALFVSGLTIDGRNIITHKGDCLKAQACFGVRVSGNEFSALANGPTFRFSGCVDVTIDNNKFNAIDVNGYVGLSLPATGNSVVSGNNYTTRNFRFLNNEIRCGNRGIKIENTKGSRVIGNTFEHFEAISGTSASVWFATGSTEANFSENKFIAPAGTPLKNDIGAELVIGAEAQSVAVKSVAATSVTAPVVTTSDAALNSAKSYVVSFTTGRAGAMRQMVDDKNKKTLSAWMATTTGATLGWNSAAWHTATGAVGDITFDGGVTDNYGTEAMWWAQSMIVIDRENRLTCRNWASPNSEPASTLPLDIGALSIAERAWITASFRPPLIVDGAVYDPAPSGLQNETEYLTSISGRCALGQKADGTYVLVVVDGKTGVSGCTLPQLSSKMLALGCVQAYNLDGGGSTTLWYSGAIINTPSDAGGERKIPAVLYV